MFSLSGGGIEVLEPGAGSGNIIKTLQKYGNFSIDAVEIRPEETENLQQLGILPVLLPEFCPLVVSHVRPRFYCSPPGILRAAEAAAVGRAGLCLF